MAAAKIENFSVFRFVISVFLLSSPVVAGCLARGVPFQKWGKNLGVLMRRARKGAGRNGKRFSRKGAKAQRRTTSKTWLSLCAFSPLREKFQPCRSRRMAICLRISAACRKVCFLERDFQVGTPVVDFTNSNSSFAVLIPR